ncbi:mechanosensitive ion channel [Deefgea tanakiae]|uniref:Mechanosensitive ion channel n=1 Tax=Deefgea tanakiae TaxID=2865840 RepID=A0ABX8ZA56_9NEIS|nr:mechanosensitive ion channel family protein [Deefgea tanakiae]QZA79315.1 mechanosensitive ion channel [Deefgea tanakiae]
MAEIWFTLFASPWQDSAGFLLVSFVLTMVLYVRHPSLRRTVLVWLFWLLFAAVIAVLPFAPDSAPAEIRHYALPFVAGLVVIRLLGLIFFRLFLPPFHLRPPRILQDILVTLVFVIWGMYQLRQAGLDLSQIVVTSTVLTAMVAFAMQDTIGNVLAGLTLQWDASIEAGDWIKVDDAVGKVVDVTWRATYLETRNGETVVLPNSVLTRNRFAILGKRQGKPLMWRRWVYFDVSLETLPTQIISMVEAALKQGMLANVAESPVPQCILMEADKGVGRFALRYWLTDLMHDDATDSLVRTAIDAALRRNGRRFSPPQYNLLLSFDNKKYSEVRHKRHTEERLAVLHGLELLAPLNEDELLALSDRLKFTPFVHGETVLAQGADVDWLYILIKGEMEQTLKTPDGETHQLGVLNAGSFFGEISLMTGERFPIQITALGNAECYRLDRATFQALLVMRHELAEAFSLVLARRQAEYHQLLSEHAKNGMSAPQPREMLARLRDLFGLPNIT